MTTSNTLNEKTIRGHTVEINGFEMYYEEYGAGKTLVLLHGFGGSTQNWHPFTSKLSVHYRLIVVDLRGHGYSTNPMNTFTHREAAGDVFLLLDKLGIVHFSAMGMSSGGMTLLHMATTQPGRIDAMVVISATSHFTDRARAMPRCCFSKQKRGNNLPENHYATICHASKTLKQHQGTPVLLQKKHPARRCI